MVGILIISHGAFGEALIDCAGHVLGERPLRVGHVGLGTRDDPDTMLPVLRGLVKGLDQGDGVLLLSDMLGATPCNLATRLLEPGRVAGISGVNLPMLMRALTYREQPLALVLEKALSGGSEGVIRLGTDQHNAAG